MPGILVLIRHGQTAWSLSGQHTGLTDVPLTDHGREEAAQLAPRLRDRTFALVLSSPLSRARDTAELAGLRDIELDDQLHEWDYGDYEGLTTDTIREQLPGWTVWTDPCPGGETADQVAARTDAVLDRARPALEHGDVALVAHGHVLRVLTARWLGLGPGAGRFFALDPATVSELGHERDTPVLSRWNT